MIYSLLSVVASLFENDATRTNQNSYSHRFLKLDTTDMFRTLCQERLIVMCSIYNTRMRNADANLLLAAASPTGTSFGRA